MLASSIKQFTKEELQNISSKKIDPVNAFIYINNKELFKTGNEVIDYDSEKKELTVGGETLKLTGGELGSNATTYPLSKLKAKLKADLDKVGISSSYLDGDTSKTFSREKYFNDSYFAGMAGFKNVTVKDKTTGKTIVFNVQTATNETPPTASQIPESSTTSSSIATDILPSASSPSYNVDALDKEIAKVDGFIKEIEDDLKKATIEEEIKKRLKGQLSEMID